MAAKLHVKGRRALCAPCFRICPTACVNCGSPRFTIVAIVTLALGIGANTAIFTLVHAVMLQSLPVKDPGSLYRLGSSDVGCCVTSGLQSVWDSYSYALYQQIDKQTSEFSQLAAFQAGITTLGVRREGEKGPARPFMSEYVSGNYFPMLGLQAAAGRLILPSDDRTNAAPAAVMSYRTWQNHFASDPSVVGARFALNGAVFTIVGIAPVTFYGDRLTDDPPDFWIPLAMEPSLAKGTSMLNTPSLHWLYLLGRLKPGASLAKVQSEVTLELQQWLNSDEGASTVADYPRKLISKQRTTMLPAAGGVNSMASESEKLLRLLMAASGLVLLIACANIANLLLARSAARESQTAVRLALGARRWRLMRQVLTESMLLALIGGLFGIVLAFLGTRGILAVAFRGSRFIPLNPEPSVSVLLFSFGLAVATGFVFGIAPAWLSSKGDPAEALGSQPGRFPGSHIVAEITRYCASRAVLGAGLGCAVACAKPAQAGASELWVSDGPSLHYSGSARL